MNKNRIIMVLIAPLIFMAGYLFMSNRLGSHNVEILIEEFGYDPSSVTIEEEMKIRWTNVSDELHTVNSPFFESGILRPGDHFDFEFIEPGVYRYVCAIHANMRGVVTVE